jgi:predicted alpha/beta superfamily hydrolase
MCKIRHRLLIIVASSILATTAIHGQTSEPANIPREVAIDYTKQFWIKSKVALGEQFLIKIFLPKNYFDSDSTRYPALYLTDADAFWGAATDFPYLLHWNNPSILVVGISYGSWEEGWGKMKRNLDLYPEQNEDGKLGAEYFLTFLRDELMPSVESQYRIDRSNRTLFGWSAGGMFALYALFKQPELFRNVIAAGVPSRSFKMEEEYSHNHNDLPVKLYMGVGEYDAVGYPKFQDFARRIAERGYRNLKFKGEILPTFKHEYGAAATFLSRGLEYMFFPQSIYPVMLDSINREGIEKAIAAYHDLKSAKADVYNLAESELDDVGHFLLNSGRVHEAIQIFKLNVASYPESSNVYNSLGEAYMINGDIEFAIANYRKSLELNPKNTNAAEMLNKLGQKKS